MIVEETILVFLSICFEADPVFYIHICIHIATRRDGYTLPEYILSLYIESINVYSSN